MTTQQTKVQSSKLAPRAVLRFTGLHVENWRNFTLIDVGLPRRTFLVGPNAAGKSNFLDLARFLQDVVAVGGGFQAAVRRRGGVSRLRCLAARRYSDIVVSAVIGSDDEPDLWRYELAFTQDNRQVPQIKRERVDFRGATLLRRPNKDDERDPQRLTQTSLEQVNLNQEFRAVADFFRSVKYLHIVPQLVREPDRSVGRLNDPYGGDFLEQIASTTERTKSARFRRITEVLRIAVPQLRELELWRDERGAPHIRGRYEHWRSQGAWQNEDQFSDGTLRLLGLLWAALDGAGPLLLEEPELSLHPEVIRYIPQMFARIQRRAGRQIVVSTHSTELLSDSGIGLDEVLLLLPREEGTSVRPASDFAQIRALMEGDLSVGEAILPLTRPQQAQQLALFGD